MRRPEWLTRETERWEADAIITPAQRRAILDRYPETRVEQLTSLTLVWLAWLVGGFGFILLASWNWAQIPIAIKIGGTTSVALALYGAAWRAAKRGADRRSELLAFAGALALGAVAAAVTDWLHLARTNTLPLLFWSLGIAVTALVSASPITTALGAGVLVFWALTDTGRPPAPWAFMLVFPFLAVATERRTQVYAAGMVTVAFGIWAGLIGLDTWRSSSIPGMMLLAAGSAIDVWAHQPVKRRPAFARTTPALALIVIGLAFGGVAALQGGGPTVFWGDPAVSLPGLTLLVSLTLVSLWPSSAQKQARWRPMVFGGLLIVWAASSLAIERAEGGEVEADGVRRPPDRVGGVKSGRFRPHAGARVVVMDVDHAAERGAGRGGGECGARGRGHPKPWVICRGRAGHGGVGGDARHGVIESFWPIVPCVVRGRRSFVVDQPRPVYCST